MSPAGGTGHRAGWTGAVVLAVGLVTAACAPDDEAAPPTPEATEADEAEPDDGEPDEAEDTVTVETSVVATGLEAPWEVVVTDDAVYVTERDSGRVLELDDDGEPREVATFDVNPAGEGGLLGLAAGPDDDGHLYAYYTSDTDNRVVRFQPDADGETESEPVLTGIPAGTVHNGGRIAFGPDDMLYVTTGDAQDPALSQDPDSLAGKILRLRPDGAAPDDNPEPGSPVFASGIRNSQGLAWDDDGQLYAAEFGPDVDDAVLRIEPGVDQDWGPHTAGSGTGERDFPDPVAVEQPPEASWSGAGILHDGAIPQWEGDLFVAALRGERLWRFDLDTGDAEQLHVGEFGRLRQVAQAPDGSLWLLTSNRDGRGSPEADDDRIIRLGPVDHDG